MIIPWILITGTFQLIAATLVGLDYNNHDFQNDTSLQVFLLQLAGFIATALILYLFIRFRYKEKFTDLGFQHFHPMDIWLGLTIGFTIMSLGFLVLIFTKQIKIVDFNWNLNEFLLAISTYILVAFTEELLIRGYVLGNLLKCMNKYLALLISSIIFSLMHAGNPNIDILSYSNLFLAGILLGVSYLFTKNLWFPIALHFSWNFFQGTIFGFNVSGFNGYSILNQYKYENNYINGGLFGFEGSIISIFALLLAIIIVFIIYKKHQFTAY